MSRYPGWSKKLVREHVQASAPNKYHAVKKEVDGITFHSTKEAKRYTTLKAMERAGMIRNLELQLPVKLHVNGILISTWVCDFFYIQNGQAVWEDTKGMKTKEYKLKKKLFEAIYGVKIRET